ncbi:unnamed protein product, partial [Prorocentrum cordatum]
MESPAPMSQQSPACSAEEFKPMFRELMLEFSGSMTKSIHESMGTLRNEMSHNLHIVRSEAEARCAAIQITLDSLQQNQQAMTDRIVKIESGGSIGGGTPSTRADPWAAYQSSSGSGSSSQGDDDNKIWLRGFPRKMLAPQFKAHYETKVLPLLHDSIKHNVKPVFHNMSFSYMVVFPSKTHAQQFKDGIASRQMECDWVDPRDNVQHQIRAGAHKPLEIRKRGFVLSQLWRMIKEHLLSHHLWREGVCSLGTNAYKGSLYFSNGIEAWELFKVEEQSSGYRITPMVEDLSQIQMNEA